jgi:hypothetical protein
MATSIANINGANPKRLHIEQFGSARAQCVLTQPLIADADVANYNVTIEDLYVSSDIPIFPRDTKVFTIIRTSPSTQPDASDEGTSIAELEPIQSHRICTIGPVYNFLDFAQQIQQFFDRFNHDEALITHDDDGDDIISYPNVVCNLDGSLAPQKILGFKAPREFWEARFLLVEDTFGSIFDVNGAAGYHHVFLRHNQGEGRVTDSLLQLSEPPLVEIQFTDEVENDFIDPGAAFTVPCESRMDLFENRARIRIDSVLPLPHEVFCVGGKAGETTKVSNRYTFMEFDFPKETLFSKLTIDNNSISDEVKLRQELHTGIFRLLKPEAHSGVKTMLPGQTQDHQYEIRIVRKRIQPDGSVKLVSEKWDMDPGDYFRMTLLFTKQV